MPIIEEYFFRSWEEFAELFENYNIQSRKYMFRGHSNKSSYPFDFQKWSLISSFNRIQQKSGYTFSNYLSQQLENDLFKITYGDYSYKYIDDLANSSLLQKCYFFQHYGIPTCFIDFTLNPFVALYFAITNIVGRSGGSYDIEGNPTFYSTDTEKDYISIYAIDTFQLKNIIRVKEIEEENFNWRNLDNLLVFPTPSPNLAAYVGIDLNPCHVSRTQIDNYNLSKQMGCFLYYDNEDVGICFEDFVKLFCEVHKVQIKSPIIKIYNISYNSLFKKLHSRQPDSVSLFSFLRKKKLTGQYLFNDIQGLKYDFNFFHND